MVYHVIGLMSGSSLDGLDIVYTELTEVSGKWSFELIKADCIAYDKSLSEKLNRAKDMAVPDFLRLHTGYGRYLAQQVNEFIRINGLEHKIHFIASHGHTVWHEPSAHTTTQIGDGSVIAALTQLPVISDLRNTDVALGGQGAPIVPIADSLLFADYDFCLNIGGIANITVNGSTPVAFDICPANQILNHFAQKAGKEFDHSGEMARGGTLMAGVEEKLDNIMFYNQAAPKSLHNGFVHEEVLPHFETATIEDGLFTAVNHIVRKVAQAITPYTDNITVRKMRVTGGGAFNHFLIEQLSERLAAINIEVIIPEDNVVKYKEALAMALIGTLRWREEINVTNSVTGAARSSVGGALWLS